MNTLSSSESEDSAIQALLTYCKTQKTWISDAISIRRVPGKGLGIYSTRRLAEDERLMYVPTPALFTTSSIPTSFADRELKTKTPVHALLANYLAFGLDEGKKQILSGWMGTWPRHSDFADTMPMFWPGATRGNVTVTMTSNSRKSTSENGKCQTMTAHEETIKFTPIPPSTTTLMNAQRDKFQSHIEIWPEHLFPNGTHPTSNPLDLLTPSNPHHRSFIHAWSAVNSRCFYYVRPGQRAPKDSNEAMALSPGMDLFNHSDTPNAQSSYDRKGFEITVLDHALGPGEEILLNYGGHGNDTLWTEYGFLMDGDNEFDGVSVSDEIVLGGLSAADRETLRENGYLGRYLLSAGGLDWRSQVVAWLGVLTRTQWARFVEGKIDAAHVDRIYRVGKEKTMADSVGKKRPRVDGDGNGDGYSDGAPSIRAKSKQIAWLARMQVEAENSLRGLLRLYEVEKQLLDVFADTVEDMDAQSGQGGDVHGMRVSQAKTRHRLCVTRWAQILRMCSDEIARLEDGCDILKNEERTRKAKETVQRITNYMQQT